jgi:type I restriction enzyme, S subunit
VKNLAWPWRPLGELFDFGAGKTVSPASRPSDRAVPFLRTSNVYWDRIDLGSLDYMSLRDDELEEKRLRPGDLLVCEGGEIGRAAIWTGEIDVITFQNHLHRLRPKRTDVVPRFYVYFLQAAFTQLGIFEGAGNKTTIPNLSKARLAALVVPHPDKDEQEAIAQALRSIRDLLVARAKEVTTLEELFDAVLHQRMTGAQRISAVEASAS